MSSTGMYFLRLFLLLFLSTQYSVVLATATDAATSIQSLDGSWQLLPASPDQQIELPGPDEEWLRTTVPSNWALNNHNLHGKVWLRTFFTPAESLLNGGVRINFGGIDYSARVWLNRNEIGTHTGYFAPFSLDAGEQLIVGSNELLVLVDSPLETGESWSLNKTLIKGIYAHHDTRPGGAWSDRGQEQNTGGIWNSVEVEYYSRALVTDLDVTASVEKHSIKLDKWSLRIAADLFATPGSRPTHFEITGEAANFASDRRFRYRFSIADEMINSGKLVAGFDVESPQLWYPAGHGEASLYNVSISVYEGAQKLSVTDTLFGFRKVEHVAETGEFRINNRRLFVRGTNYISSQWLSEMGVAEYQRDIDLMLAANINAVRVHAHIERDEFYQLADKAGLLVWQDFPLQWGYSDSDSFREQAVAQALEMVDMLGNHPSVVNWTLQNEPPFDAFWMKWKYQNYDPDQNRKLVHALSQAVSGADSSRWIEDYSATNTHPWLGWYSGTWKDYAKTSKVDWVSEFGAQALPRIETLQKIFFEDDLWPQTERQWNLWRYRNFQPRETFEIAGVSMGDSTTQFIENTQFYQARLLAFAARSLRLQKYSSVNGVFQFMFVENWPSINWGVLDYWRNEKPGYRALAMAYQPTMPVIEWTDTEYLASQEIIFGLWMINDRWQSYPAVSYTTRLYREGHQIEQLQDSISVADDSVAKVFEYRLDGLAVGNYRLEVEADSRSGELLGLDMHEFTIRHAKSGTEVQYSGIDE